MGITYELVIALLAATGAGLLRGMTGFGSSLVLAPVLAQIYGPQTAVAISLMTGVAASTLMAPGHLRDASGSVVSATGIAGLVFLLPGLALLHATEPDLMRRVIGLVTLVAAIAMLVLPGRAFPSGLVPQIVAGSVGGLVMGATSMGGPPVVLYLVGRDDHASAKKANVIFVVGGLEIAALVLLAAFGSIGKQALVTFAILIPAFALGMFAGQRAFGLVGDRYRNLVLVVLLGIGIVAAIR